MTAAVSLNDVCLIGQSHPMQRLRALVATVAPTRLAVLIEGETGTGKELVAALLHQQSGRSGAHVAFNVCALGESMFEDALFGHAKGAFTGAFNESMGFLREANGGTAFFDEISGLPLPLQAKLLRAIETGVFRPIGASRDARSDFRPVAATNEQLSQLVDEGRFRPDLWHRLSGIVITMPTLAERVDDIPLLVHHFVRLAAGKDIEVEPRAMQRLSETSWPGNIRDLRQAVSATVAFAHGVIDVDALDRALAHRSKAARAAPSNTLVDRNELVAALEDAAWNPRRAASLLGIHRATVYRRMRRHGIHGKARASAGLDATHIAHN